MRYHELSKNVKTMFPTQLFVIHFVYISSADLDNLASDLHLTYQTK